MLSPYLHPRTMEVATFAQTCSLLICRRSRAIDGLDLRVYLYYIVVHNSHGAIRRPTHTTAFYRGGGASPHRRAQCAGSGIRSVVQSPGARTWRVSFLLEATSWSSWGSRRRQGLHDRHFHPVRRVHVGELRPDHPAAHDHAALGQLAQLQRLARGEDGLAVHHQPGQ